MSKRLSNIGVEADCYMCWCKYTDRRDQLMDKKWTRVATPQDGRVTQQWLGVRAVHLRATRGRLAGHRAPAPTPTHNSLNMTNENTQKHY